MDEIALQEIISNPGMTMSSLFMVLDLNNVDGYADLLTILARRRRRRQLNPPMNIAGGIVITRFQSARPHSLCRACSGSVAAARHAGSTEAASARTNTTRVARIITIGSKGLT